MAELDSIAAGTLTHDATADALRTGAVVRWWQTTAFLEVAGHDAASFLDGLCTQAVERVEPGHGVLGLFLDAKAKLIAPAIVHRIAHDEPRILLETLPDLASVLRAHLARYRLRAKLTIEPLECATIAVVGEAADAMALPAVDDGNWSEVHAGAFPMWAFVGSRDACALLTRETLPSLGLGMADVDAFEAARIARGIAGLHDLLPGRMPAEIGGMDSAVALDAGCYLGQEPVARLHYRGHANRTLRRLDAPGPIRPQPAAPDDDDAHLQLVREGADDTDRSVGRLTTWARRPDGSTVALAVLRREVEAGDQLRLVGTDSILHSIDAPSS